MLSRYRVIQYGVGAIGAGVVRALVEAGGRLVGAIDNAPDKAGRDVGEVAGLGPLGVQVSPSAEAVLAAEADVVVHCTGSFLEDVAPQLQACLAAGKNVVSTCEELAYPFWQHPDLARRLDEAARRSGVTVLGTGVNPGFVMDTLALALSGVCQWVSRVEVTRIVDVATRRAQLQRKVGVGLSPAQFEERKNSGRFGHVGLMTSARLVADRLGLPVERWEELLEPVLCDAGRPRPGLMAGQVAGIHQSVAGWAGGRQAIRLELEMSAGSERPRDEILVEGQPPLHMVVEGGVQGDLATAGVVVNCIPAVVSAPPGLVTMADLPVVHAQAYQRGTP